jgi:RimJ/RimL family protein N-acetyltransferase
MNADLLVTIAPMAPAHVEGFRRAVDVVARERKYLTFLEAPPLEESREFVLELIARGDPQFVAFHGEEVIGWCDIVRHRHAIHKHRGTLGMGILPGYRGQGVGLRLIQATLAQADRAGFVRVELSVHANNPRAISLYEKVGFAREGIQRDAICIDGEYCDSINMALINPVNRSSGQSK